MEFGDRVHYVRSRGIRLEDAVLMCLGDVKSDIGYFTPLANFDEMWWKFQSAGLTPMQKEQILRSIRGFDMSNYAKRELLAFLMSAIAFGLYVVVFSALMQK